MDKQASFCSNYRIKNTRRIMGNYCSKSMICFYDSLIQNMSEKSDLNRISQRQNDQSQLEQYNQQPSNNPHKFEHQTFQDIKQQPNDSSHINSSLRSQQEKNKDNQNEIKENDNERNCQVIKQTQGHRQNKIIQNFDEFQDACEEEDQNKTENDLQIRDNHDVSHRIEQDNQFHQVSEVNQGRIQQQSGQKQILSLPNQNLNNHQIQDEKQKQQRKVPIDDQKKPQYDPQSKPQEAKLQVEQLQKYINTQKQGRSSIVQQFQQNVYDIQKQRFSIAFSFFSKYNVEYQKIVSSYKLILKNVRSQIKVRQQNKSKSQSFLIQYFENYIKMNKQFHERSYKIQKQSSSSQSTNKFLNIKQQLKQGFERLFYMRKTLADEMNKLQNYITSYTIKSIHEAFEIYKRLQSTQSKKQDDILSSYESSEKKFQKNYQSLQKLFKKCLNAQKSKQDVFAFMAKYVTQQEQFRKSLISYGKSSIQLRQTFILGQKQLLFTLQRIINEFKLQSRRVYAAKKQDFLVFQNYAQQVEKQSAYQVLCTITDVDYIKSILQLQNRNQAVSLSDQHYLQYLQLPFLDKMVGDKQQLLKLCCLKTFAMLQKHEELVHSISGNLVQYHSQNHQCKQKYNIRNITVCQIKQGILDFDEFTKGLVFTQTRRVSLKFSSNPIAQQFVCYLNQQQAERLRLQS